MEAGYGEEDVSELLDRLEELLEENEYESVFGEMQLQYNDVRANMHDEPEWYYSPVMNLTYNDVLNGYKDVDGNLTGDFGVADNVTIAEATKMAIEIGNIEVSRSVNADHWAEEAGYVDYAKEIGLAEIVDYNNLDEYATREDVAIIISEIMGWIDEDEDCETEFKDYDGEFVCHVDAVNLMNVFEGDGLTGEFAGDRNINRAETAKAFEKVLKAADNTDTLEELSAFEDEYFATE
jgi:hypothetical protein